MSTDTLSTDPARLLELGASLEGAQLWGEAVKVYEILLDLEPTNMTAVTRCLTAAFQLSDMDAAEQTLLKVAGVLAGTPRGHLVIAQGLLRIGRTESAAAQYRLALAAGGGVEAHAALVRTLLSGPDARTHFEWARHLLRPARMIVCAGAADTAGLDGPPIDLAWLDGPRRADAMLDDVIALERHAAPTTALLFAGALPLAREAAEPEHDRTVWQGEAWKLVAALARWRPDLRIVTLPARTAGVTVVTRLDPASRALAAARGAIVGHMATLDYAALAPAFAAAIAAETNDVGATARALGLRSPS